MASGFFALLDDVAGIARLAAASLDDVGATAGRVGLKAAGVVVDDAAVVPGMVAGFRPERELPMIGRIVLGSLRNKIAFLLPAALLLNALAPWAVAPLLMLGGAYLCYEGAEKLAEAAGVRDAHAEPAEAGASAAEVEDATVRGAVRTDLILSAEIMAIALAEVADRPLAVEAAALALVAVAITLGVYGVVALVVKADDVGLSLARRPEAPVRACGRALVRAMPPALRALSAVGTAAMLWVGGGILLHGLAVFGLGQPGHALETAAAAAGAASGPLGGAAAEAVEIAGAGCFGVACGAVALGAMAGARALRRRL